MRLADIRKVAESFVLTLVISVSLVTVAAHAPRGKTEDRYLNRRIAELTQEHEALERWVAAELRPWVLEQTEQVVKALPPDAPHPSIAPLPPPPTILSPATTPSPSPSVSPVPSPTEIPSVLPSATCIPVVGVCVDVSPSP